MATKTSPSVPVAARFVTRGSITRSFFGGSVQHPLANKADLVIRKSSPTGIQVVVVEVKHSDPYPTDETGWEGIFEAQRHLLRGYLKTSEIRRRSFDAQMLAFAIFDSSMRSGELPNLEEPSPWSVFSEIHAAPALRRLLWSTTASGESSLRKVIALQERAERLGRLSPERRKTFERIAALRESIGPGDFDVSEAVREMREDA